MHFPPATPSFAGKVLFINVTSTPDATAYTFSPPPGNLPILYQRRHCERQDTHRRQLICRRLKHTGKLRATLAVMVPISTLVIATPPTEDSRNTTRSDEEEGPGDTDREIGGGGKLPAAKDVPAVEMTVEAEGAFMCGAKDTRDGEDTTIDGEGASVYRDMAPPDSDGAPAKGEGETANDKIANTDCDRASTETDSNTVNDNEAIQNGVEKL